MLSGTKELCFSFVSSSNNILQLIVLFFIFLTVTIYSQNLGVSKTLEVSSQVISTARKSHDAAVGALVHMFRTAPPLRQDSSCYSSRSMKQEIGQGAGSSSAFFLPRKTSDALEELRAYKDMKELLLSKSARMAAKEEA